MTWAKKNVSAIVGWAVLVVGASVGYGMQRSDLSQVREDMLAANAESKEDRQVQVELASDVKLLLTEREEARQGRQVLVGLASDVRSLREGSARQAEAVKRLQSTVDASKIELATLAVTVTKGWDLKSRRRRDR